MDWMDYKPLIDIGLGGIALVLYWKQGKFLGRLAASFETHVREDMLRGERQDARIAKLENKRTRKKIK